MDIEKMLSMQKELDERIIKEKGLEGKDLFPNTVLALQVELAEFANEGRWFKHWSNDQVARNYQKCHVCFGTGETMMPAFPSFDEFEQAVCPECEGDRVTGKNPLLEEFVDGVHFFLSIAIQKGWEETLWVYEEQLDPDHFDGELTSWYLEMIYFLTKSYMEKYSDDHKIGDFQKNAYYFRIAWMEFLNIGINGFGFTMEQIEQAYMDKNAVNHKRQENGY
jgi:dimeric dUTPase (all-alpha-NTP-PPase superfamily)